MDPNYKGRRHALFKCARAALDKGYKLFGIENGGQCFGSVRGDKRYHKYGTSKECKGNRYITLSFLKVLHSQLKTIKVTKIKFAECMKLIKMSSLSAACQLSDLHE